MEGIKVRDVDFEGSKKKGGSVERVSVYSKQEILRYGLWVATLFVILFIGVWLNVNFGRLADKNFASNIPVSVSDEGSRNFFINATSVQDIDNRYDFNPNNQFSIENKVEFDDEFLDGFSDDVADRVISRLVDEFNVSIS